MHIKKEIAEDIYYVGVNDRQKQLFEGLWELPHGVSYNSYLIVDEKVALVDTVDACYTELYIKKLESALEGRAIDYLIINHMEPDHSASIKAIRQMWPDVQIVGNAKTFKMLEGYFGITEGLLTIKENSELPLGKHNLRFVMTPMVHWIETMMTLETTTATLFSGDAFGSYGALNGAVVDEEMITDKYFPEMERYYTNIVGKYGMPVQKALAKFDDTHINMICSTHGPVWKKRIPEVLEVYNRLSKYEGKEGVVVLYASMYGNTEQMAEAIADGLARNGVKNIILHNVSVSTPSQMITDVFRYKGLIIGSPTYSNELFPGIKSILDKIQTRELKHRVYACFGSCSWAGVALKKLTLFGEEMNFDFVGAGVEEKHALKEEQYMACLELAKQMAEKIG